MTNPSNRTPAPVFETRSQLSDRRLKHNEQDRDESERGGEKSEPVSAMQENVEPGAESGTNRAHRKPDLDWYEQEQPDHTGQDEADPGAVKNTSAQFTVCTANRMMSWFRVHSPSYPPATMPTVTSTKPSS